jgi:hypothetical protein
MSPQAREPENDRSADVLSNLPRHRPGRRTNRRAGANGGRVADGAAEATAKSTRRSRKPARSGDRARDSGRRAGARAPRAAAVPLQGFETEDDVRAGKRVEPPSRFELATSLVELAGEGVEDLVKTGFSAGGALLRRTLELIPKR